MRISFAILAISFNCFNLVIEITVGFKTPTEIESEVIGTLAAVQVLDNLILKGAVLAESLLVEVLICACFSHALSFVRVWVQICLTVLALAVPI